MRPARAVDAGAPWAPDVPSQALAREPFESPRWASWLESQWYTGEEIRRLQAPDGLPGEFARVLAERTAGAEPGGQEVDIPALRQGVALAWLSDRPPESVLRLDPRPSAFLSPSDMGARLRLDDSGRTATDVISGATWHVSAERGPAAAAQVIGAALYRELGVLAPSARIVTIGGERAAAWMTVQGWVEPTDDVVTQQHLQVLHAEAAADAWLSASPDPRVLVRPVPHELTGTTCRSDMRAVVGYVDGHAVVGWPSAPPPVLPSTGWWEGMRRGAWASGRERVIGLPFATLDRCVRLGAGEAPERARMLGDLLTRRALLEAATSV